MTTISSLEQLESRVHDLINKIGSLHSENQKLNDQLSISRQDLQKQSRELENERRRAQEAEAAVQTAASLSHTDDKELIGRIEQQERQIELLEQELEKQRNQAKESIVSSQTIASSTDADNEFTERIEYQAQQIELLERERIALRDQVSFLQSTLQNKEKDWHGKLDVLRRENEQQRTSFAQSQTEHEQKQQSLQNEKNNLTQQLAETESSLKTQTAAKIDLQNQLDAALKHQAEQETDYQNQLNNQREQADTKLLQEQERFRMEYALLVEKHEQNLGDLTQAMNVQKERLVAERDKLQQKINQLDEKKQQYRQLLIDSAADIRRLLDRLPPLDNHASESNGEAA